MLGDTVRRTNEATERQEPKLTVVGVMARAACVLRITVYFASDADDVGVRRISNTWQCSFVCVYHRLGNKASHTEQVRTMAYRGIRLEERLDDIGELGENIVRNLKPRPISTLRGGEQYAPPDVLE